MFKKALISSTKRLRSLLHKKRLKAFAVIGAFAVSKWARPRATADIDFVIALDESSAGELAEMLQGSFRPGNIGDPLLGVIEYQERSGDVSIPIQLVMFPPAWEEVALHKIGFSRIDGVSIPIADWRALVLLKLYAGSALDVEDARSILGQVKPEKRDLEYLTSKATRLRVSKRLARVLPI